MLTDICVDCGAEKETIIKTQSLQCNDCQNILFDRLRAIAGSCPKDLESKKRQELIVDMLSEGMKAYEIAEEFNIDSSLVYRIIRKSEREEVAM